MSRFTVILGVFWLIAAATLFTYQFFLPTSIEVSWETESEFDTAGFNILRSDSKGGPFVRINETIIPGSADPAIGGSYQFVDSKVEPGTIYYYRLEDLELDGTVGAHQVIEASAGKQPWWLTALALVSALAGIIIIAQSAINRRGKSQ